jgi:tRNA (guanine-N7-)-methyltransferase
MPSTNRLTATAGGPAARPHPAAHSERRIRSFHPRRGRITTGQASALARRWASWGIDIDGTPLGLRALFGQEYQDVVLEIGFGMGDATAEMAAADPARGILAADVHTPGQGNLLALAEKRQLTNIRVANGDAVILLRDMLAPGSLAGIRIFFPDPWPKARHHKRRLIQPEFTALAASRLRPGSTLHCATDWEPYADQMLKVLSAEPALENAYEGHCGTGYADTDPRPAHRPMTKFEQQGLANGHVVHDLLFRRR